MATAKPARATRAGPTKSRAKPRAMNKNRSTARKPSRSTRAAR